MPRVAHGIADSLFNIRLLFMGLCVGAQNADKADIIEAACTLDGVVCRGGAVPLIRVINDNGK